MAKKSKAKRKTSRAKPKIAAAPRAAFKPVQVSPPAAAPQKKEPYSSLLEQIAAPKSKFIVAGMWAMILAVILSVMFALIDTPSLVIVLVAIGFIVGFLNFEHEETVKFLVATASLLIICTAILLTGFSRLEIVAPVVALFLERAAYNVIAVVAPAALVVSLKAFKELAE
ncbi:hypothetical protein JW707_00560 [Candidatus Woesearchaeota archaeon]|nr:hypothetical protein [Candidatus Woesearchaeota archaeon]